MTPSESDATFIARLGHGPCGCGSHAVRRAGPGLAPVVGILSGTNSEARLLGAIRQGLKRMASTKDATSRSNPLRRGPVRAAAGACADLADEGRGDHRDAKRRRPDGREGRRRDDPGGLLDRRRSGEAWPGGEPEPAGRQRHRRDLPGQHAVGEAARAVARHAARRHDDGPAGQSEKSCSPVRNGRSAGGGAYARAAAHGPERQRRRRSTPRLRISPNRKSARDLRRRRHFNARRPSSSRWPRRTSCRRCTSTASSPTTAA